MAIEEPYKNISLTIPESMYSWLEEHKEINRSSLFREAVESKINPTKRHVSSLMFLASMMGIIFSVALIGIGVTSSPIDINVRGILTISGGILAIATMALYYKETKTLQH
jgi:hypothetical protein